MVVLYDIYNWVWEGLTLGHMVVLILCLCLSDTWFKLCECQGTLKKCKLPKSELKKIGDTMKKKGLLK